jgi:hypothetical protein
MGVLFNARTFPFACGPGKADHNIIFQALRHSLDKAQASADTVWSHHHGCWTTLRAHVIAFLMDQPEQRGSNCPRNVWSVLWSQSFWLAPSV